MKDLLKITPYASPDPSLKGRILAHIRHTRLLRARMQAGFFGTTLIVSLVAFIPAIQFAVNEVMHSSFYQYLSLMLTDSGALASSWRELTLALVESAPVAGTIVTLAVTFLFLASLRAVIKNMGSFFITEKSFAS